MDHFCRFVCLARIGTLLLLTSLGSLFFHSSVKAQSSSLVFARPKSFAIVIGSNKGSEQQQTLRFAQEDADDVATVLRQIGGYEKGAVQVLKEPDPIELRRTIQGLAREIKRHEFRDEKTQLFFYYSGHANAKSLNLGGAEFSLSELRELLSDLSASLTLVVLDACQSGAFSRAEGAEPASDFAYNSVSGFKTEGFAVISLSVATRQERGDDAEKEARRKIEALHWASVSRSGIGRRNLCAGELQEPARSGGARH